MNNENSVTGQVRWVCMAILVVLAFMSAFLHLHLIFGITFVFTNIFLIALIRLHKLRSGLVVAAAVYAAMIGVYDVPVFLLIFFLELLWIGLCLRKKHISMLRSDLHFWLLVGFPVTLAASCISGTFNMIEFILLFAITASNGLFNTLTSEMLHYYVLGRIVPKEGEERPPITFQRVLFHLTVTTVSLPFLINLIVGGWHSIDSSKINALQTAGNTANGMMRELGQWKPEDIMGLQLEGEAQLGYLEEMIQRNTMRKLFDIVISGSDGRVLAASNQRFFENWEPKEEIGPMQDRFIVDIPNHASVLPTGQWHDADYVYMTSIDRVPFIISVIIPVMPYQEAIFREYIYQILYMMASASIAAGLAFGINAWFGRSLKNLAGNSTDLPVKLKQMASPEWPSSGILEIDSLTHNFKGMSAELLKMFEEMESMNRQLRASEEKLQHLAYYDSLTGLPNRLKFRERLNEYMQQAGQLEKIAVMFVDINRFNEVNDALGHTSGDLLLLKVALRFDELAGEHCEVFRLGGDEFIFLYRYAEDDAPAELAKRISGLFDSPVELEGNYIYIALSIGISIYPEHGRSQDEIVRKADMAMCAAKEKGISSYFIFDRDRENALNETMLLENSLRNALREEQFYLVYQPKVNPSTGRMTGYEALLRWNHPELGSIPPSRFIPIAEAAGMIADIDFWMLREACRQTKEWHESKLHNLPVSVNLSTKHFYRTNIVGRIHSILRQTGLASYYLGLDLTESVFMNQIEPVKEALDQLKNMGIEIVIEEFGTGYTSLSQLRHLPVSTVKLDRTFLQNGEGPSDHNSSVLKGIVGLVHSMGLRVTAEGIETEQEQKLFIDLNCDELQGNFFSSPLDALDFERYAAADSLFAVKGKVN